MIDLQILDETLTANDPNYNTNDSTMKRIWCRIESFGESAGP